MNLSSLIIPPWVRLAAVAVVFLAGVGLGGTVAYRWEHNARQAQVGSLLAQEAQDRVAVAQAAARLQHEQDALTATHAVTEARAQERIVTRVVTRIQEVPRYVTAEVDHHTCIPWGLVRVLDAASTGVDPADLVPASGEPDDACSPVTASALAAGVAANYGIAEQNAEQLDALIADVLARTAAAQAAQPPAPVPPDHR